MKVRLGEHISSLKGFECSKHTFLILMKLDGKGYHAKAAKAASIKFWSRSESWGRYINYVSFQQKDMVELGRLLVYSGE